MYFMPVQRRRATYQSTLPSSFSSCSICTARMASSSTTRFTNWFKTFCTFLHPEKDYLRMTTTFNSFWGHSLMPGPCHTIDLHGNWTTLEVAVRVDKPHFKSGALRMAEFYGLTWVHVVAMHYIGDNVFHIRIFDIDWAEINYPSLRVKPGLHFSLSGNFFRTFKTVLSPDKNSMVVSGTFSYFWKEHLVYGDANVTDPKGNEFCLQLSVEEQTNKPVFASGVRIVAEFYRLRCNHKAWLHYLGDNEFEMKFFSEDEVEIHYPFVINDSQTETEYEVVSQNHGNGQIEEVDHIHAYHVHELYVDEEDDKPNLDRGWIKQISEADTIGRQALVIPASLLEDNILPMDQRSVTLRHVGGRSCQCTIMGGIRTDYERYLGPGWYEFVRENDVGFVDLLIFWFNRDASILNVVVE